MKFKETAVYTACVRFPYEQFKKGVYHTILVSPVILLGVPIGLVVGLVLDMIDAYSNLD